MALFEIKNLTYKVNDNYFFNNFNLEIEEKKFISIIAPNRSGKTMLTKIISAIIPTYEDNCILDGIILSKETVLNYITKIGVASNEFNSPFLFSSVREELSYPLENLGYSESKIDRIISKISEEFDIEELENIMIKDLLRKDYVTPVKVDASVSELVEKIVNSNFKWLPKYHRKNEHIK